MIKRLMIVLILVAGVAAAAGWFAWSRRPAGLMLHETLPRLRGAWPLDKSWSWSFPLPPRSGGNRIAVEFRVKEGPLSPTNTGREVPGKPMSRTEADRSFGTAWTLLQPKVDWPDTGTAAIQLLDLADVGAMSDRPGQSLRLLANLSIGGMSTHLGGDELYLPPGELNAQNVLGQGEQWVNGELHLMTFWVDEEDRMFRYDALLVTGPEKSAQ